ncbi:MAG: hypothetical protein Q8L48_07375 [Archangium sp.]|nr:hypothetical protein [Archangium sp.]
MTWRLLVLLLGADPQSSVSTWASSKGVDSRELRFTDKSGDHVVRFTLTRPSAPPGANAHLTVIHTVGKKEVWRAKDFVEKCEFDLTLDVVEGSIRLTDLDADGEPEVSFLYRLSCRSDVSPLTAKLLLYEGATKYALRGETKERVGENEFAGGDFTVDPSFQQAPKAFLEFAKAQWKTLIVEPAALPR